MQPLAVDEFPDLCDELAGLFEPCFFLLLMWVKYFCWVRVRYVGMKHKIIDGQPMRRMSDCTVRFVHCGRSFISPEMYKSASTKRITMYGSVLWVSSHFRNASTYTVHMPFFTLWVHWYRCCIVSGSRPQRGILITVGSLCYTRCYSYITWWSVPYGR